MVLSLIDPNGEITRLVSPGFQLPDVIGRKVTVYLGAQESSWPEDYNEIFRGVIQQVGAGAGFVDLTLNNTDEKKRAAILPRKTAVTTSGVDYRSVTFQDIFYKNREDITNVVDVTYVGGGMAGSESVVVGGGGYSITVQIQDMGSTAAQIRKAIENDPEANQLVEVKISGDSSQPQTIGSATLGISLDLTVDDASSFLLPSDGTTLRTFLKIKDELVEYTGITGNQLTGLVRGADSTTPAAYSPGEDIEQVIRLSGVGIDIALKLMLSNGPAYFEQDLPVASIEYFSPSLTVENAMFFVGVNLERDLGVRPGDLLTVVDATNPGNNVVDDVIQEVGLVNDGSYLITTSALVNEPSTSAKASFKSQFNVLPIGLGMLPSEVDVAEHVFVRDTFLSTLTLDIPVDEIPVGKDFLEKDVYLPMTCFSVPRKARSSVVFTVGPLPTYEVVTLDVTTVENPAALRVQRSMNENFYNQVQFDYDYRVINEKYGTRRNYPESPDQTDRPVGIRPFKIEAKGFSSLAEGGTITERAADRLLRRYQNGAEFIKGIKVLSTVGYQIEIGDIVAVDYKSLKLSDFTTGDREGSIKLMEVQNKILDTKTGEVTVDVVNTVFGVSDRYGLISPSSQTGAGSTTTKLILKKSWSTKSFERESKKWNGYLNQNIIVHNEDFSTVYTTTIRGFDNNDPQGMSVDPIPAPPGEDWIIQCVEYPSSTDQAEEAFWKQRHAFFSPRVAVVAGVSNQRFTVDSGDVGRFFIGSVIRVHTYDFSSDSPEVTVTDIQGNDILTDKSLTFTPDSTFVVDLIGFPDKQQAYRVV